MEPSKIALVVDDSPEQLEDLARQARRTLPGWKVLTAKNEVDALGMLRSNPTLGIAVVDLFLSEPQRSVGEGLELLKKISESSPACYKILVSKKKDICPDLQGTVIDRFVSLLYVDTNPVLAIRQALTEGRTQSLVG